MFISFLWKEENNIHRHLILGHGLDTHLVFFFLSLSSLKNDYIHPQSGCFKVTSQMLVGQLAILLDRGFINQRNVGVVERGR
jgi:hypothetical protein